MVPRFSLIPKVVDFRIFPRHLGSIVNAFGVEEFQLTFTQGRWDEIAWGAPIRSAPTGAQLGAWFYNASWDTWADVYLKNLTVHFQGFRAALGSASCASLNFMDHRLTSFVQSPWSPRPDRGYYASLPRESVCTENLTPWLKALPCRDEAGFAVLLNPQHIYNSPFSSLGTHFQAESPSRFVLTQYLTLVSEPKANLDWNLEEAVNAPAWATKPQRCPFAETATVELSLPSAGAKPLSQPQSISGGKALYQPTADSKLAVGLTHAAPQVDRGARESHNLQPIIIRRYLTGYGKVSGGLAVEVDNLGASPLDLLYTDVLPWYVVLYGSSFRATATPKSVPSSTARPTLFAPAENRGRPTTLEVSIHLEPNSSITFQYDFDKAFMQWQEFPPDPNRGFDIGPACVSWLVNDSQTNQLERISLFTPGLMMHLPTPDFSMPYNVMTLSGTVVALLYGALYTVLHRRYYRAAEADFVSERPITKIVNKLMEFVDDPDD